MTETEPFDYEARAREAREAQERFREAWEHTVGKRGSRRRAKHEKTLFDARNELPRTLERAYPPGFEKDYQRLRQHDSAGIKTAIRFLEADPWFFRSGYVKSELLRLLKKFTLDLAQRRRLKAIMINTVRGRDRREFRDYCRLARKIDDPELRTALATLTNDRDEGIRRRAQWMLYFCEHGQYLPTVIPAQVPSE